MFFICVDDIIITANNIRGIRHKINGLSTRFSLKDLGQLHYVLGVSVNSSTAGIFLSQLVLETCIARLSPN